jgi:hypothetical protein
VLSEDEFRALRDMEQRLAADDPRFAAAFGEGDRGARARRVAADVARVTGWVSALMTVFVLLWFGLTLAGFAAGAVVALVACRHTGPLRRTANRLRRLREPPD